MPVTADASRPIRTVDSTGQTLSTDTGRAAPIKTVDSVGRAVQAEASKVAEQAAAEVTGQPQKDAEPPPDTEALAKDKTSPDAADRRGWLQAQREKRRRVEAEKRAEEATGRAEALAKAKAMAETGEDPTAILREAGLDIPKYYETLTKYALSDKAPKAEDPVQKELREHKERLDKYAKDLEVQTKTLEEREALQQHNKAISDHVIPILMNNQDKYEAIFAEYGQNAAVEVYRTVWEIYQQTGKARKFEEVADEMEAYWSEQIDKGIQAASKLKKFQNRFAQSGNGPVQDSGRTDTRQRSVTLSNRPSAPAGPANGVSNGVQPKRHLTWEERAAEILKRHG